MLDEHTLLDELLEMAKLPDAYSKSELAEMLLVAATEIIKLQEFGRPPGPQRDAPERSPMDR
jgi:hypothetical protein